MATEQELEQVRPRLFGLIAEERIAAVDIERPDPAPLAELSKVADLSSAVSDALDQLGIGGGVGASTLAPLAPGQRVIGPAITIRYVREEESQGRWRRAGRAHGSLTATSTTSGARAMWPCSTAQASPGRR